MIHTTISNYSHDQRGFILSFCQMKQAKLQITAAVSNNCCGEHEGKENIPFHFVLLEYNIFTAQHNTQSLYQLPIR